jgi:cytidyltransferase-like protein
MNQDPNGKIRTFEEIAEILKDRGEQKVVYCHGVFDLLHIGHLRHFKEAKSRGDILVVSLTPDKWVDKGPHRPAFTEQLRAEALASLAFIDWVFINQWPTAVESITHLRPDFFAKGQEFEAIATDRTGKIAMEVKAVEAAGAKMIFTKDIVFSSSNLINRYLSDFPDEIQEYLALLRSRHSLKDMQNALDSLSALKVLVLGDTILDEYQYCEPMGKSSKDPVLAVRHQSTDLYAGGILAIANHVAQFADQVDLITVLGDADPREDFIRAGLEPNVSPTFFFQKSAPTLIKRRYLDSYSLNKMFEVYVMDDRGLDNERDRALRTRLAETVGQYDLVLAGDFGHGAISQETAALLSSSSRFLAIMTQANAGNRGLHTFTRYPRADYVCIAEHEMRLELRTANGDIVSRIPSLAKRMDAAKFTVTRGRKGCCVYDVNEGVVEIPAFAPKVVDRVGAGDAFLSLTSLGAAKGLEPELIGFFGNVIGSLAVSIIGNKKSIDKKSVDKVITSLMK